MAVLAVAIALSLFAIGGSVAGAASATHQCGSTTVKTSYGPVKYTHITAKGVTCNYVKKTFLVQASEQGPGPKGWKWTYHYLGHHQELDVVTKGQKKITFQFKKTT